MFMPLCLFFASAAGLVATLMLPEYSDMFPLAAAIGIASIILLIGATLRRRTMSQKWVVIDGSNVMYWKNGVPLIQTVKDVVAEAAKSGAKVGVIFDANAGHLLSNKYLNDRKLGKMLGLPRSHVMVVPKGVQADPYILSAARDMGARIVTNDKFRDWTMDYPEASKPGHLIQGKYEAGQVRLSLS